MAGEGEAELGDQAQEIAAALLPLIRASVLESGSAATMMGLAYVAGELIAAAANTLEHLEAGLSIFTGMAADQRAGASETKTRAAIGRTEAAGAAGQRMAPRSHAQLAAGGGRSSALSAATSLMCATSRRSSSSRARIAAAA